MNPDRIRKILDEVAAGVSSVDKAFADLKHLPFEDLGFAKVDGHRAMRRGIPEVVFGENKSAEQIAAIANSILKSGANLVVTRVDGGKADALRRKVRGLKYYPEARVASLTKTPPVAKCRGAVTVISAGTSDLAVAEEAAVCAELFGNRVVRLYDVGVAGLHRLTANVDSLRDSSVLIVVAGMEGALPSVVAGLLDKPVIGVPTSVGYGAAFGGIAALLGMLNTCSSGVTVVNIDNGFGAAFAATLINRSGLAGAEVTR